MPTMSVKLPDSTKAKLQKQAKAQGVTSHALMVSAIETALSKSDQKAGFMEKALMAHQKALKSGAAYEGSSLSRYLKAKVRGEKPKRPVPVPFSSLKPKSA
jgi:predicted transcriptional regulator